MKLTGRLIKGNKLIKEASVEKSEDGLPYRDLLEACLLSLCKNLDIQVPIWLKKNTTQFALYRKTSFSEDQFMEKVKFDRFEIKID